jgi:eukaryotic-like serine/threonine-protein kinase
MMLDRVEVRGENGLAGTPYRPIARIGAGTSAEVFEAEGPGGERRAVKVLRSIHVGTGDGAFRLEQEARALASLRHPNLVRVLDAGVTADGRPYFAMPRLYGETLRDRLRRQGPIAPAYASALLAELLEGVGVAHAAGIIHRDIKPANIFLTPRSKLLSAGRREALAERCILLDFGLAKLSFGQTDRTTDAHILGTPRYLAPEQILGGSVDARTDVYAAGLVLFEMIAGRSPYEATDSVGWMTAHVGSRPPRLRSCASVSAELDHVVARALAKEPSRRWTSARVFAEVLARASVCERALEAAR